MNKKAIRDYIDKYADIPKEFGGRFNHMMSLLNIKDKDLGALQKGMRKLLHIRWLRTNFVFYMIPKATPRARRSGRTGVFYVKDASDNSQLFKKFIDEEGQTLGIVATPCRIYIDAYIQTPSSMSRFEKIWSELKLIRGLGKPDYDNVAKTYGDMVQKYYLLDDALIVEGHVRKFYSCLPRVEIQIEYMEEFDCKYHKKKVESWKTYQQAYKEIDAKDSIV
ncbi:Endodeoxyribonuclease RusA [compost metagenome]